MAALSSSSGFLASLPTASAEALGSSQSLPSALGFIADNVSHVLGLIFVRGATTGPSGSLRSTHCMHSATALATMAMSCWRRSALCSCSEFA